MKTRKRGDLIEISWFGWGTMNVVGTFLLFAPPVVLAFLVGAWITLGMPAVDQTPLVQNLGQPASLALAVVSLYVTFALMLNWRNRVVVTRQQVRVRQGAIPWLVSFRRRRVSIAGASRFEVISEIDTTASAAMPHHISKDWVVLITNRGNNVRISGNVGGDRARRLCEQLNNVLSWAKGSPGTPAEAGGQP
jgi:hypothetical protein